MTGFILQAKSPKQAINISSLHVSLAPDIVGHNNGILLSFLINGFTRHIYLYAEDAKVHTGNKVFGGL